MKESWNDCARYRVTVVQESSAVFRVTKQHTDSIAQDMAMVEGRRFNVNVVSKLCDCGEWQGGGVPCVHAMAYNKQVAKETFDSFALQYVSAYHTFDYQRSLLQKSFHTVCLDHLLRDQTTLPPNWSEDKKTVERPKMKQRLRK
jgi:hypothetical protein